jgi:hypothetical protein
MGVLSNDEMQQQATSTKSATDTLPTDETATATAVSSEIESGPTITEIEPSPVIEALQCNVIDDYPKIHVNKTALPKEEEDQQVLPNETAEDLHPKDCTDAKEKLESEDNVTIVNEKEEIPVKKDQENQQILKKVICDKQDDLQTGDPSTESTKEENTKCNCLKERPLIDQITITDVTKDNLTVTIKECSTDKGFFCPR